MTTTTTIVTVPVSTASKTPPTTAASTTVVHALFLGIATIGTSNWFIFETFRSMKSLILCTKDKVTSTIATL
jgi:hypothetical protein